MKKPRHPPLISKVVRRARQLKRLINQARGTSVNDGLPKDDSNEDEDLLKAAVAESSDDICGSLRSDAVTKCLHIQCNIESLFLIC